MESDFKAYFLKIYSRINSSGGIIMSSIRINFQLIFAYYPNPRLGIDFTQNGRGRKGLRNPSSTHLNFRFIQKCLCHQKLGCAEIWLRVGRMQKCPCNCMMQLGLGRRPEFWFLISNRVQVYVCNPRYHRSLCQLHAEEINDDCRRGQFRGKCIFG